MKYEQLFLEEIDDVVELDQHAEEYRVEYNPSGRTRPSPGTGRRRSTWDWPTPPRPTFQAGNPANYKPIIESAGEIDKSAVTAETGQLDRAPAELNGVRSGHNSIPVAAATSGEVFVPRGPAQTRVGAAHRRLT